MTEEPFIVPLEIEAFQDWVMLATQHDLPLPQEVPATEGFLRLCPAYSMSAFTDDHGRRAPATVNIVGLLPAEAYVQDAPPIYAGLATFTRSREMQTVIALALSKSAKGTKVFPTVKHPAAEPYYRQLRDLIGRELLGEMKPDETPSLTLLTTTRSAIGSGDKQPASLDLTLGRQPFPSIIGDVPSTVAEMIVWLLRVTARFTIESFTGHRDDPRGEKHEFRLLPPEERQEPHGSVTIVWAGEATIRGESGSWRVLPRGHVIGVKLIPIPTGRVQVVNILWRAGDHLHWCDNPAFTFLIEELNPQIQRWPGFNPYRAYPEAVVGPDGMLHIPEPSFHEISANTATTHPMPPASDPPSGSRCN